MSPLTRLKLALARRLSRVLFPSAMLAHPPGHYYSPIADQCDLRRRAAQLWPERRECYGIDFDDAGQVAILEHWFPRELPHYDYPDRRPADGGYAHDNPSFGWLDSRALFVLVRTWRPRRVIEVGAGYSTLLLADLAQRHLHGRMELCSIDPYPPAFLRRPLPGLSRLIERPVQELPWDEFARLEAGDVLFIDSSHVVKTGSDVVHLFLDILPRLPAGVRVHVHDVFLPDDYPPAWAIEENRSWNEQYLLQAMLIEQPRWRVIFGSHYVYTRHTERLRRALGDRTGAVYGGGSFWIERR